MSKRSLEPLLLQGWIFSWNTLWELDNDMDSLRDMMSKEELFIMKSPDKRRILIDLYETNLTDSMILEFVLHIKEISTRIVKLGIAGEKKCLKSIHKALLKDNVLNKGQIYVCHDMEEAKTWLVSDSSRNGI